MQVIQEKWIIGNDELLFDEATHQYTCNGIKCISVTQILKTRFKKKYSGVNDSVLKTASEKGTKLHKSIEMYEKYGILEEELEEFNDYLFLKDTFKFEVTANEIPVVIKYKDLVVCGRLDLVIKENEKKGIADIKRTATLDKNYLSLQLNLYRLGYEQCYGEKIELLRGIHLKDGKRKYAQLPINEDMAYQLLDEYIEQEKIEKILEENKEEL